MLDIVALGDGKELGNYKNLMLEEEEGQGGEHI